MNSFSEIQTQEDIWRGFIEQKSYRSKHKGKSQVEFGERLYYKTRTTKWTAIDLSMAIESRVSVHFFQVALYSQAPTNSLMFFKSTHPFGFSNIHLNHMYIYTTMTKTQPCIYKFCNRALYPLKE